MCNGLKVYRAFIIPLEGERVREVRDDDKEFWRDLITNNLKTFLRLSLDLAGKARAGVKPRRETRAFSRSDHLLFQSPPHVRSNPKLGSLAAQVIFLSKTHG